MKLIFAQNLRTISVSTEEQSLKILISEQTFAVKYKIVERAVQLAKNILLHAAAFTYSCSYQQREHKLP